MLQKEFTEKTNVRVSFEEFKSIRNAFECSGVDIDTFCAEWCKRNPQRAHDAKMYAKVVEIYERYRTIAIKAYWRNLNVCDKDTPCTNLLSVEEVLAIEHLQIHAFYHNNGAYFVGRPIREILGAINSRFKLSRP